MATTIDAYNLLIIEDDISEQKLIKLMIKTSGYSFVTKFIDDGEEAINFINSFAANKDVFGKIHLVLLDLNLPKVNGIDVLKTIKSNSELSQTPVVVLTTSNNKSDIKSAYEAGASGYVRKPSSVDEYEKIINQVFDYWFNACIIP